MSSPNAAALLPLAESIADGSPIDWAAAEARASAEEKAVIRQLRILSGLAGLHRRLPAGADAAPGLAPPRHTLAAPAIGSWAHLALIERLGGGTFGDVYRAWDRHLEREVALKLLRGDDAAIDDLRASRIANEGRLLARVRHPNVITVYGVDSHDGRVGLWMELVRGATLEQQVAGHGPLSAREAAMVGIDLCRALAAIHAAGLIHRDVKAQNVMREDGGRIVLMDLGTGREVDRTGQRAVPDLAGTPLYLAPELLAGTAPASERTDLYSLGVLLYHLVTGTFPVRATTIQDLHEGHKKGQGIRLRDARADLPTAFVRVVDRAIAGDPSRRYESAGAFEADLDESLAAATPVPTPAAGADNARARWSTRSRVGMLLATLAAILALAAIGWPARGRRTAPAIGPGAIRAIAVLPLANLSGDPSQEYFADGMTDQLIGTLGELGGVNVISRTSAMLFKGSKKPLPEIARALKVDAVLEGAVVVLPGTRAGDPSDAKRVRITARLIYAGTDTQLWDRAFERVGADVLALQGEIARAVADGINLRLSSQQQRVLAKSSESGKAQQFDAFDLYLKGRYYWNMRTDEGLKRSIGYFQEAIDRNPTYALGYSGLADAYNMLAQYGFAPWSETLQRARVAATKALALDESLAEAHASLAFIHNQQLEWSDAEAGFKRAIALKPGYAVGHHWYANCLMQLGRFAEAIAEIDKAVELDPLSIAVSGARGSILLVARRYDEAVTQLEKTAQMDPAVSRVHMVLAEAYAHRRQYERALAEINTAAKLQGGGGAALRADIGYVLAVSGRRADAMKIVGDLTRRYRLHEGGSAGALGVVFAGLADKERAFEWLNRAVQSADPVLPDLKTDPRLDNVRTDPRFAKLLASAGFAP